MIEIWYCKQYCGNNGGSIVENIVEIMKKRTSFSFEVFPPKLDQPLEPLMKCLDDLYKFKPDFISCTYGAGGTNAGRNMEICKSITNSGYTAVSHLTCIKNTREKIKIQLQAYLDNGIDHILALRGDMPAGWDETQGDFNHANELVAFIREQFGDRFTIAVAGNPEKHIECPTFEEDIAHLKIKQDAGADYIMTQLCFDMEQFKRWRDQTEKAGITIPVDVGVMPVLSKAATIRIALSTNGCSIPRDLAEIMSRYHEDPEGFEEAGMEYTIHQLYQLMGESINGIHLYTMNRSVAITEILTKSGLRAKSW